MIEWLLKEEEKAKVGRPKLADNTLMKKASILLIISAVIVTVMTFSFVCIIKNENPKEFAYKIAASKLSGVIKNKNGFITNEKYINNDYELEIKIPNTVSKYQGSYKYILYKLNKNNWEKVEDKTFDRTVKSFKINIETKKNKNQTYKIKLSILNGAKIKTSFAPSSWQFVDANKNDEKYAYKVFTVKGYYSPVSNEESKEAKKNKDKISISTSKENPRIFTLNTNNIKYDAKVIYTDEKNKTSELKKVEGINEKTDFLLPNINKISKVTIKVWLKDTESSKIDDYKLSNWTKEKDKDGRYYITNTYMLKPENGYKLN